jgi:hypothetical protein
MTVKSKVKELFKKVISPYHSFRKFFGSTNTNLLLLIFLLMFLILNINTFSIEKSIDESKLNPIVSDVLRFESLNNVWTSYSEYDFLMIRKQIESMDFNSDSGSIVFKAPLNKFVYQNTKFDKNLKELLMLEFESLSCDYNYCYFSD